MSGAAPDPLDRIADRIDHAEKEKVWATFTYPELRVLVEIARAARAVHEAFIESGDCRTYPLVQLYVALAKLNNQIA